MSAEFIVSYNERLVRAAVKQFWRRDIGWRFPLALLLLAVILVYQLSRGDYSWYVGMLGTIFGLGVLVVVAGYFAQRQRAMQLFRGLETGQAVVRVTDARLRISSNNGTVEFPWKVVREIWRYPEFWLLVFAKNSFATLPLAGIAQANLDELERNVRQSGGRIA